MSRGKCLGRTCQGGSVLSPLWLLTPCSDPTCSIVVLRVKSFQTKLMVEICSKSLVRAIGKVLLMKFS